MEKRGWKERYGEKLVDAARAVKEIKRGQRIFVGSGAAKPQALVDALALRGGELTEAEIIHMMTLGPAPYTRAELASSFRHNALFIGPNVRDAILDGRADYTPIFLSEIPRLFRSKRFPVDVALIQVSQPDEHGFCSYGVSVDVVKAASESAGLVIAEVNPRMPRTLGDSFINVRDIDLLVEHDAPIPESVPEVPSDLALEVGRHVARLIDNGSTLQIGIGSLPNAVLQHLRGKKNLGVHTEMISDGIIDLVEAGVVDCSRKNFLQGKLVTSFCVGTRRLYDYVDNNPLFEFRPIEFTNDPFQIARNSKMVAINGALEVDLTGQVCADSIGPNFYSGIGGQVDFMRGAARSEGGKPIIVLSSTAKNGTVSRIVPHLREGAGVVTTRGDVHYVVTEYGIADLWGRSVRDRALALIAIAHPKFRKELLEAAKRNHLIYQDQLLPTEGYPSRWEVEETLRDGLRVFFRPVKPTDETLIKDMFYACSDQSIYNRFFGFVKAMPHTKSQKIVNVDYKNDMAIAAIVTEDGRERMIALGAYALDQATNMADVAFLVADAYQGKGAGSFLLKHLMKIASAQGVAGFTADVLAENHPMLRVFQKSGCETKTSYGGGAYHLEFRFETKGKHAAA